MRRIDSLEKTQILGKIEGRRRRRRQRMRWLDGITDSMDCVWASSRSWWWTGKPGMLQSMGSQGVRHDWVTNLNWTESNTETGSGLPPICQVDCLTILKRCNVFWGCFRAQHESRSALINNYCHAQRWRGWLQRWSLCTILDYQKGTGL